ncbi:hypothetical protein VTP01DRAFT_4969 [Rhizomucor pusillus]|uniref:uncharacterized protein n=1 Tax=Rhizomucor pusillus TaxID=4840 RepID=UPI003742B6CE
MFPISACTTSEGKKRSTCVQRDNTSFLSPPLHSRPPFPSTILQAKKAHFLSSVPPKNPPRSLYSLTHSTTSRFLQIHNVFVAHRLSLLLSLNN